MRISCPGDREDLIPPSLKVSRSCLESNLRNTTVAQKHKRLFSTCY